MKSVDLYSINVCIIRSCILLFWVLNLSGCGYNDIQSANERIQITLNEILNQYQRRCDLVPQLVNVVKSYTNHESEVLTTVTQARSAAAQISATTSMNAMNPLQLAEYQQAQQQLDNALSQLLVVSQRYPDLKANSVFRDLIVQLKETESSIAIAKNNYIKAVQEYNSLIRQFPEIITAKVLGYKRQESTILHSNKID